MYRDQYRSLSFIVYCRCRSPDIFHCAPKIRLRVMAAIRQLSKARDYIKGAYLLKRPSQNLDVMTVNRDSCIEIE